MSSQQDTSFNSVFIKLSLFLLLLTAMGLQQPDYECRIVLAIKDRELIGLRASARKHSVKLTTLRNRCAGSQDIRTAYQKDVSLTVEQEEDLVVERIACVLMSSIVCIVQLSSSERGQLIMLS